MQLRGDVGHGDMEGVGLEGGLLLRRGSGPHGGGWGQERGTLVLSFLTKGNLEEDCWGRGLGRDRVSLVCLPRMTVQDPLHLSSGDISLCRWSREGRAVFTTTLACLSEPWAQMPPGALGPHVFSLPNW